MWRARSASDKTDDWPYWYVTNDEPKDYNATAKAFELVTGNKWPLIHQFLTQENAKQLAEKANTLTSG